MPAVGLMVGILAASGILLVALGMQRRPVTGARTPLTLEWARLTRRPTGPAGRRRDLLWAAAAVGGVVAYIASGWWAALLVVPALIVIAPKLLGQAPSTDIPLLVALDTWVRNVATLLPQGRDVVQAIRASQDGVPELIREPVTNLVRRMGTMGPRRAFQLFADELDSPEADAVVASMMLAAEHPTGLTANLQAIAANIQARLDVLRKVEAERSKPRNLVRQTTIISGLLLLGLLMFSGGYLAPLRHPAGQIVVILAALLYVASLWRLYQMAVPRQRQRILVSRDVR